jgi:cyanophycinase
MPTKKKAPAATHPRKPGRLLIIGGAEDPDENDMKILPHFVEMCGGSRARIIVCGSSSQTPEEKEREYKRLFEKLGAAEVFDAGVLKREDAERKELVMKTRRATGVFFTGGDQLRLTSLIAGTAFGECVHDRLWHDRLVVGGTSAGAAAMSSVMMISGSNKGTVRRADIGMAPGLGLLRDTTIDTHFAQRGRISRILTIFAENPQILGIGIDENTAIDVTPGVGFEVLGEGACFVVDGKVTHSNAPEVSDDETLAVTDSLVHVLPTGYRFDLKELRPILPNGEKIHKRQ